jgi:hypothetical protein
VTLRNDRVPVHPGRAFNHPVTDLLLLEATGIADPVFHFTPLVFTTGDAEHFIPTLPECNLTLAGRTVTMRINGLGEPYPVLEPESLVRQGSY